jgi:hypothetical protein
VLRPSPASREPASAVPASGRLFPASASDAPAIGDPDHHLVDLDIAGA